MIWRVHNKKDMFSVIIPLYNKAPYIEKALRSVFAQTCTDYELIVVDDGSKDDSKAVAEQVLASCPVPYQLISQTNSGVSMARNNGVAASQGEYICFLDADDWWEPTFLEEMAKLIAEFSEAGIYGTGYTIVNETKHKTRVAPIAVYDGFEKGYINYCQVYAKNLCMPLTSISVAVPRSVFEEAGGFQKGIRLGEDFILWIRIALKHKVAFLNKPLANYNQDVDVANRGVGHLHNPENHMLWNLGYLEEEEKTNPDYKQLIDNLRVYGLLNHYLSEEYHDAAKSELAKVDWNRQPKKWRRQYRMPVWRLKARQKVLVLGSQIKNMTIKMFEKHGQCN